MEGRDELAARLLLNLYDRLAQKVIYRFKRYPKNVRHSPDDSGLANVWEEYKDQVQEGESFYFDLYEADLENLCRAILEKLPEDEWKLLWLYSDAYIEWDEDKYPKPPYSIEDVVEELMRTVRNIADVEEVRRTGGGRLQSSFDF